MKKHLITSGCSFTDTHCSAKTWPIPLKESLGDIILTDYGLSSSGNDMICRQAIYGTNKLLTQGVDPKDILVGVMWSGAGRHDFFYSGDAKELLDCVSKFFGLSDHEKNYRGLRNPYKFIEEGVGNWILQNPNWPDIFSQFRTQIDNHDSQSINTYERILWLQNYFQTVGVDYFCTSYFGWGTFPFIDKKESELPADVRWMHKLVDWSKWLPVDGEFEWCYDNGFKDFGHEGVSPDRRTPKHPTNEMHKQFVTDVILPHLKSRNII